MVHKDSPAAEVLQLPSSLLSRVDVMRLSREVEALSGLAEQQARSSNDAPKLPRLSPVLEDLVALNQLDFTKAAHRQRLQTFLQEIKQSAPNLHMSFAAEPSTAFSGKLITWLRTEIHPLLLLDVGLQPTIAAGCIIRTTNKIIDCSLRQHLVNSRPELLKRLQGVQHA